ncbi:peptidoglycan D,D-transpeptidase FtsI family protein [Thomasclavelia cocleata]|uniref:peptidoglycan D,D-transpeptidase FtsI family protein n=1 Tax=Thomasclavelia cocleata TaxID=69824 RepID=UPI00242BA275|nr:penicillin-binding protein 2 [Thomasclavelia cocleata]
MSFNFRNKMHKIRFYGALEQEREQKSQQDNIISRRLIVLLCFIIAVTSVMAARLAFIQFNEADELAIKLEKYGIATYSTDAPRGEIVDREYTKLVQNTNVICATYYAPKKITDKQLQSSAKFLAKTINLDTSLISKRNKKDYFLIAFPDLAKNLVSDEEKIELKKQANYEKALLSLQIDRISDEMLNEHLDEATLIYTHFYYLMKSCTSGSSILAEGITEQEASIIGENADILPGINVTTDWSRQYVYDNEFKQVLGKVTTKKQGLPVELKNQLLALGYQNDSRVGVSGLEKQYEEILRGNDSSYTLNYDSKGNPIITNAKTGTAGSNIRLTIDWELQQLADKLIEDELKAMNSQNRFFNKMFFTMMDPYTGEIIVMSGKIINKETGEVTDYAAGNYLDANLIGSTIKGGTVYTGFKEGLIQAGTTFMDEPIKIKGTKEKKSHRDMGLINEIDALAYSSNVYMFRIAMLLGGANYVYDGPLKINDAAFETLRRDLGELGLGVKTGIDVPYEELGVHRDRNRTGGLLLDASIGQYDTYTNIQLAQYACTLANGGKRIKPRLMMDSYIDDQDGTANANYTAKPEVLDDVSNQATAFSQIKQGMRACVTRSNGTCNAFWSGKSYITYAKTGTAEDYTGTGDTDYPNHLQIGYIQADENSKPAIAFACVAIRQTKATTGTSSAPYISHQIVDKYVEKYGLN